MSMYLSRNDERVSLAGREERGECAGRAARALGPRQTGLGLGL